MNNSAHKFNKNYGFTLIELLLSITVLGILSGVLLSTLNVQRQRQNAEDSVRMTNLNKLVQALEAYNTSEKQYPSDPNNDGNPSDDPYLGATYLQGGWLNNKPAGSTYTYYVNSSKDTVGIVVKTGDGKKSYKYRSTWGKIQTCLPNASASDDSCN